jgi:hypothetical protein
MSKILRAKNDYKGKLDRIDEGLDAITSEKIGAILYPNLIFLNLYLIRIIPSLFFLEEKVSLNDGNDEDDDVFLIGQGTKEDEDVIDLLHEEEKTLLHEEIIEKDYYDEIGSIAYSDELRTKMQKMRNLMFSRKWRQFFRGITYENFKIHTRYFFETAKIDFSISVTSLLFYFIHYFWHQCLSFLFF